MTVYILWLEIGDWWNELLLFSSQQSCWDIQEDLVAQLPDYILGHWYHLYCIPQVVV